MKKNDKIIVAIGIVIILIASGGILYTNPVEEKVITLNANEFYDAYGTLIEMPDTISVSDSCPFYPLIATPLAINYNEIGVKNVIPLYVKNITDPSGAVERVIYDLQTIMGTDNFIIDGSKDAKEISLEIAEKYWESSEAALIIEYNESGYNLGVIATPIASYLSIPVIVTDEIDNDVQTVLNELGVEKTLICGENLEGYGETLKFNTVEEIVDMTMDMLFEKFGEIDYLTITNPIDAWPPKVLDSVEFTFGPETLTSSATTRILKAVLYGSGQSIGTFTIPSDYKYAKIKFEGINLDSDDVDEFGDAVSFSIGPNIEDAPGSLGRYEVLAGGTHAGGIPERDASGNIITDKIYIETVVYDRGGVEYNIGASGSWLIKEKGEVSATVVVEKLDSPLYEPMKALSSIAPYLTAYHKGLIFGKPDFAFAADDDVINDDGDTCPGFYMPRRNPGLTARSNEHIYDEIHMPINEILAKLADVSLKDDRDIKSLTNYYTNNPINIAIVGGATVIPNYIYQNHVEPMGDLDGDGSDDTPYYVGGGTPSDVIYGNIDPIKYDWSNLANDIYSEYPFMENVVGRITGWDVQDASALVARSVFYNEIIEQLGDWKDTYALLIGGGSDFKKPLVRYMLFGHMTSRGEPMKYDTGKSRLDGERTVAEVAEPMGFNVLEAYEEDALREGLSDKAISEIKQNTNILNKFFFRERLVKNLVGEGAVIGGDIMESSNFIWATAHGNQHLFGMDSTTLVASGFAGKFMRRILEEVLPIIKGGFFGPGSSLGDVGTYDTRGVEGMEFGPSFMWLESCICGKIDGVYPQASLGQALLHSGVTALVASPTGSNIAGGYIEPKRMMYDLPIISGIRSAIAQLKASNGNYPDAHFGYLIYTDMCNELEENDCSVGLAFRNAKNMYLPQDADWELWWAPPLISTGDPFLDIELNEEIKSTSSSGKGPMIEAKYISYQEYFLFGDPALNLYEPCNEGGQ